MSKDIKLHPKYGLNAVLDQCPLCGGTNNQIVLLGAAYKEQAPMKMIVSGEPCDECKMMMKKGVLLISVKDGTDKKNPYRTGRKFCLKWTAAKKIFGEVPEKHVMFIEDGALDKLGFPKKIEKSKGKEDRCS